MDSLYSDNLVKNKINALSTQQFLDIKHIKDGVVILNNGALRAVLMVSSINFELKATEEQEAIIAQYQNFLNSVDFPLQIFCSSRKINLKHYLEDLDLISREQTNELLHLQMEDYMQYIQEMISTVNIVNKTFYVVVPFAPVENKKGGIMNKIMEMISPHRAISEEKKANFDVYKDQLWQRVEHIQYGLNGAGIKMVPLNTQELIELYYSLYNPGPIEKLELAPVDQMAVNTSLYN